MIMLNEYPAGTTKRRPSGRRRSAENELPPPSECPADAIGGAARSTRVDLPRLTEAVREALLAVGEDVDRDGAPDSPDRVARTFAELFRGVAEDPATHLWATDANAADDDDGPAGGVTADDVVLVRDLRFFSMCDEHLLPFYGVVHVAYLPGAGGSCASAAQLARTIDAFARRPQSQRRLTERVADAVAEHLGARAVAVVVEAEHVCLKMHDGVRGRGGMRTAAARGRFRADPALGAEVIRLMGTGRRMPLSPS